MKASLELLTRAMAGVVLAAGTVTAPAAEQAPGSANYVEEVIVTAQKREERIQVVPVTVTVFDSANIEARDLDNIAQVAQYTPNTVWDSTFFGSANFSSIFIRGVGQLANFFESSADPSVAVYLDGVYVGRALGSVFGVHDIAQVEVLRGPQGTLFGRNATGGAVTITTERPNGTLNGWADVTNGTDSRLDLRAMLNLPLGERVYARFGATSLNQDGYGASLIDSTEFGDTNLDSARAALRWLPNDDLTVDVSIDWSRSSQRAVSNTLLFAEPGSMSLTAAYNFFVAPTNTVEGFGNGIPFDERFLTESNFTTYGTWPSGSELDSSGITAIVEWRASDLVFKSIASYRELESSWAADVDESPIALIHDAVATDQDQLSLELTLRGVNGPLDWLVGAYYFDENATGFSRIFLVPELLETPQDPVFGTPNPFFGAILGANGPNPPVSASSIAPFSHVTYKFNDRWTAFAGLRYTSEKKQVTDPGTGLVMSGRTSESFSQLTPSAGLQFFPDASTQLYATVSRGFKSGGFNTIVVAPRENYLPFDKETITSYELGVKRVQNRFRISAAAFFSDYEDIQLSVFNFATPEFRNAAEAEIRGVEIEFDANVSDALLLQAGIGYLDAEYVRLDESVLQGLTVPVTLNSEFPNAPEWSAYAGVGYNASFDRLGRLAVRADYAWRDTTFNDAPNTPEISQDAYGTLHAAVSLETPDGRWRVKLFGQNLTDEEYLTTGVSNKPGFGTASGAFARPRNWGLNVRYRFGEILP